MQRAEVSVEVCHVEDRDKPSNKKQTTSKTKRSTRSQTKKRKQKPVESDWETPESEWEDEDELDISQDLQVGDLDLARVRKRSADEISPSIDFGNEPATKRLRTSRYEVD
jgi:hypothetical protein